MTENHRLLLHPDFVADGGVEHQFSARPQAEVDMVDDRAGGPVVTGHAGHSGKTHTRDSAHGFQDCRNDRQALDGLNRVGDAHGRLGGLSSPEYTKVCCVSQAPDRKRGLSIVLHRCTEFSQGVSMKPIPLVVIGASAGGVEAIGQVLAELPADLSAAVLVVLHMPAYARSELAAVLGRKTGLAVAAAIDGESIEQGRVYVCVPDRHLLVDGDRIRLTRGPKETRSRPSVDALFRSAAVMGGSNVIGVVLSGMLDDGSAGLWAIKDRGGIALVQDQGSAMHGSMPESAARHVDVDATLPPVGLAAEINRHVAAMPGPPVSIPTDSGLLTEFRIAMEGDGLRAGVMSLGHVSGYTCPDCHGVLVQIEEGTMVRFRCHTGHAFTTQTLLLDVNAAIDKGLWDTLRAIEERVMLLHQMAGRAEADGRGGEARCLSLQADESDGRTAVLRTMVIDPDLFGHSG